MDSNPISRTSFPESGLPREEVLRTLDAYRLGDGDWKGGKTWSLVYDAGEEITRLTQDAYEKYFHTNGLNPFVFQSLKRLETETLSMVADLFRGDEHVVGSLTSGGSESVLMAVKTYRDEARALRPEITQPEAVVPMSAHAAFEKAAHYFGVKLVHAPLADDYRVDVAAVEKLITPNTIFLVGSAPQYPHGAIDPIEDLSGLAVKYHLRLHVDACLGGFTLPFIRDLGGDVPPFDFTLPGVSSLSADLHKYAFAAKGVSALLYRDAALRQFQYFAYGDWPGGLFISPSATGTRPGGAIASAWAALKFIGRKGYLDITRGILDTTKRLLAGIRAIPALSVLGDPPAGIFAFGSEEINIHALADALELKGWVIDQQVNPACLHFMVTPAHADAADDFLADLRQAVAEVKAHPESFEAGSVALYGMRAAVPDPGMVNQFITAAYSRFMTEGGELSFEDLGDD
ncbi:MAG: aspartate aminotransferase family protein [Oscillospiraceae bacterium]|jgi:glutamate/tyrosine decarboxylase-like PLP-dependent enzyme|nr:aspartate aminotransferase family protein [Oscillospiraceae bacterium]